MPFSCFLFRPRKSREKRRKRSHTNVSNTLVARPSTPLAQMVLRSLSPVKVGTHGFAQRIAHRRSQGETWGILSSVTALSCTASEIVTERTSRRKWMHANGVCPLSLAPRPRWAAETYSFVTAWSFLHRYQSGQQLELSIKTIRRPNVHCKTECILLQYSEKPLDWRRYMICPLSLFAMTSRK